MYRYAVLGILACTGTQYCACMHVHVYRLLSWLCTVNVLYLWRYGHVGLSTRTVKKYHAFLHVQVLQSPHIISCAVQIGKSRLSYGTCTVQIRDANHNWMCYGHTATELLGINLQMQYMYVLVLTLVPPFFLLIVSISRSTCRALI